MSQPVLVPREEAVSSGWPGQSPDHDVAVPESGSRPVAASYSGHQPVQVHLWAVCSDPRLDEVGRRKGWVVG